jgi:hypothetical protein
VSYPENARNVKKLAQRDSRASYGAVARGDFPRVRRLNNHARPTCQSRIVVATEVSSTSPISSSDSPAKKRSSATRACADPGRRARPVPCRDRARLVRAIDLAHPAGAKQRHDSERTHLAARRESLHVLRHCKNRLVPKRSGGIVRGEQRVDRGPQRSILAARIVQICLALAAIKRGCGSENTADIRPAIGVRVALLRRRIIPENGPNVA